MTARTTRSGTGPGTAVNIAHDGADRAGRRHYSSPAEEAERTVRMFKALGDPVRLRPFSAVASHGAGEACVCDISDVGVSQPTVSHRLKKLREAGLLASDCRCSRRWAGSWVLSEPQSSGGATVLALARGWLTRSRPIR
jgi:DNA-binding transcriptional ArsR family regulator